MCTPPNRSYLCRAAAVDLLLDDLSADAAAPGSAARAAERFGAALREVSPQSAFTATPTLTQPPQALLEHLCLHTHESSLPATFDARSSETGRTLQLAAPSRSGAAPPRLSYECLEACGWAAGDVLLARRALAGEQGEYGAAAAAALLSYALIEDGGCSVWWAGASADDAAAAAVAAAVEEEAGVLAAIYSDRFVACIAFTFAQSDSCLGPLVCPLSMPPRPWIASSGGPCSTPVASPLFGWTSSLWICRCRARPR